MRRLTDEEIINRLKNDVSTLFDVYALPDGNFTGTCKVCGGHPIFKRRDAMHAKQRKIKCAVCHAIQVEEGINDIKSQFPEIAAFFVDDEFIRTHSIGTAEKGITECPDCKNRKMMQPVKIRERGYSCQVCGDGVSYPNKFGRQLLKQLPIENFIPEYFPSWINKKYDNYFVYKGKQYILEMDGRQHFQDTEWSTYEWQKENDKIKNVAAKEHGIHVIRVNCFNTDFQSIKQNIINSELNSLFDLSHINWELCNKNSMHSLVKEVCDYYNANPNKSLQEISMHFQIDRHTARQYLKKGNEIGFCEYTKEEIDRRSKNAIERFNRERFKRPIYAYDQQDNYIGFFEYAPECARYINRMYKDVNVIAEHIHNVLNGKAKSHRGFHFYSYRKEDNSDSDSSVCA